jgi:hypothetical protein
MNLYIMNCVNWFISFLTGNYYNIKIDRDKHYDDRDKHYDDRDKHYYEIIKKIRNAFVLDIVDLDYINTLQKEQLIEIIKINNIYIERMTELIKDI